MYQNSNSRALVRTSAARRPYLIGDSAGYARGAGLGFIDPLTAIAAIKGISSLFGGGGNTDALRAQRAQFLATAALNNSVLAMRYILGGRTNTASHESPMYDAAYNAVSSANPDVVARATAQGPIWDPSDDATKPANSPIRAAVNRDLQSVGVSALPTPAPVSTSPYSFTPTPTYTPSPYGVPSLPPMITTAGFNYMPLALGAGLLVTLLATSGGGTRRGRR